MDLKKYPLRIESLDLEITSKCNLRCPYCYVGTGKFPMGDMTDETIEKVLDLVFKYGIPYPTTGTDSQGNKKQVKATHITFYGGEPLLSFDRVKKFIERSIERGMKLSFSALSNGTIGTKEQANYMKYFNCWLQRSIDGCPEVQEKYRPNSIKAYEEVSKIWQDYNHSRRMTVQPEFAKDLLKSLEYFESQGFWKGISPMPNYYTEWTDSQIEDFKNSLWDLGKHYLKRWKEGRPFYVYYLSREMVNRFGNYNAKGQWGCGGARGLHCVSWDGYLYMCHRFSKEPHEHPFCFGSLDEVLNETAKGYAEFVYEHSAKMLQGVDTWREECKNCIGRFNCEKGCMHNNWLCTGTIDIPPKLYCEIRKEAAKVVTWLDNELRNIDRDWWKKGNSLVKQGQQGGITGRGCGVDMCQEFADGKRQKVCK